MGQNNGYYCADAAMQHSLYKFGITVSQSQLAKWAGTTSAGTSHEGIRTAIAMVNKKFGVNKIFNFNTNTFIFICYRFKF